MTKLLELTGLEIIQGSITGSFPRSSMTDTIPMEFLEVDIGRVIMSARADHRHLNPLGGVHGGFTASVLDSVTGCAVHSALEAGVSYGTIDLQIKMLRPIPCNQELRAEGNIVHLGRNIATSEGNLKTKDGKLLATATATCFLKRI